MTTLSPLLEISAYVTAQALYPTLLPLSWKARLYLIAVQPAIRVPAMKVIATMFRSGHQLKII
jgi:hypothetical protein